MYKDETDALNRTEIISGLYKFGNADVINVLNNASESSNTLVRLAAVKSLSFMPDSKASCMLQAMLDDQIEDVRSAAGEALSKKRDINDAIR